MSPPKTLKLSPEWSATFYEHDLVQGGHSKYYMTGPDVAKMHGWWKFTSISAPVSLGIDDGFADDKGEPTGDLGATSMMATLEPMAVGTRMTMTSQFESLEQLEEMLAMGMQEGMSLALVHVIRNGAKIDAQHVGSRGVHRDDSDILWLDGKASDPIQ